MREIITHNVFNQFIILIQILIKIYLYLYDLGTTILITKDSFHFNSVTLKEINLIICNCTKRYMGRHEEEKPIGGISSSDPRLPGT